MTTEAICKHLNISVYGTAISGEAVAMLGHACPWCKVEALESKLGAREKGVAEMMEDIRAAADFLGRDGYARWRNTLLNVEQSIAQPETYRRLP